MKDEYIIVEIIPTRSKRELGGTIVQVSCIKMKDLIMTDQLYVRQDLNYVQEPDIVHMLSYGDDYFETTRYVNSVEKKFKKFIGKTPLLIMDNSYTLDYLQDYENEKISIFDLLGVEDSDTVFDEIRAIYGIEDTQDLVTILYEALLKKNNDEIISGRKK